PSVERHDWFGNVWDGAILPDHLRSARHNRAALAKTQVGWTRRTLPDSRCRRRSDRPKWPSQNPWRAAVRHADARFQRRRVRNCEAENHILGGIWGGRIGRAAAMRIQCQRDAEWPYRVGI